MQLFNLLKNAQQNNGPNENQGHKNLDKNGPEEKEFIAEGHKEELMNKDEDEGIPNEDQHPGLPRQDDADQEEIKEVEADFEETKLSAEEDAYKSQDEHQEEYKAQIQTYGSNMMSEEVLRSMDKGSPNNSGPQCIFAPDLVDTSSPDRDKSNDFLSNQNEIEIFIEDPIVIKEEPPADGEMKDQRPSVSQFRYESYIPSPQMNNVENTQEYVPIVNVSHATFTGKESERKSIDKQSLRSSKLDSPTRTRIKSHFRKANAKGNHKQMPVDNADAQDIDESPNREIENAFDVADGEANEEGKEDAQSSQAEFDESGLATQQFGKDFPDTQWHDVQLVETEEGNQELVIENLENLQNTTALVVTRQGNSFKIGIQEDASGISETFSQKRDISGFRASGNKNSSQQSLQQKLKFRGKFGRIRPTDSLSDNIAATTSPNKAVEMLQSRGSSHKSRGSKFDQDKLQTMKQNSGMTGILSTTEEQNKYKTFQDPVPDAEITLASRSKRILNKSIDEEIPLDQSAEFNNFSMTNARDAQTQYSPNITQKNFEKPMSNKYLHESRETFISKKTHQSILHESEVANADTKSLNFVKIVDPELLKNQNDKRDQNDSKMKKKLHVQERRLSQTADVESNIQNITGRANSSLNSRQATGPSIPIANNTLIREKALSPADSNKRSTISIRLQDKLAGNSVNSSMSDAQATITLKVKKKKANVSNSRTGMKSPNAERDLENDRKCKLKEQEKQAEITKKDEYLLNESVDRLDSDSRFQLQDQPSRISIVSRQSNTDMKGEDLVKFQTRTVKESDHEESPDRQSEQNDVNVLLEEEEQKQIELIQSKESSSHNINPKPPQLNEIATQTNSEADQAKHNFPITNLQKSVEKSIRSSKKILFSKSSKRSILNKSVESIRPKQSEQQSSTSMTNIIEQPSQRDPMPKQEKTPTKVNEEVKQENRRGSKLSNKQEKSKKPRAKSKISDEKEKTKEKDKESVRRSESESKKPKSREEKPTSTDNTKQSQSEAKAVNIRKIRSPISNRTLEPSRTSKKNSELHSSRDNVREMIRTSENFADLKSDPESTRRVKANEAIREKLEMSHAIQVIEKELTEENEDCEVSDRPESNKKNAVEKKAQPEADLMASDKGNNQQKKRSVPQSVQSTGSRQSRIQQDHQSSYNYHTTTEDAGENAYFPQIMKYTETGPQESILSRDHYSTSNHASMVSRKDRTRKNAKPISQNNNQLSEGGDYLQKLQNSHRPDKETENEVSNRRSDDQNPKQTYKQAPVKVITKKEQPKEIMQQVSRVENSHPKTESILSQSNKDEEKFRTTGQDSLSPVAEEERLVSQTELVNVIPSNTNVTPSVTPTYNIDATNFESVKHQKEKIPAKGKVPAIHMKEVAKNENAQQLNSNSSRGSLRDRVNMQESKQSNTSKKSKNDRLPSLQQSVASSTKAKSKEPLRSSGRMENSKRKRDLSNTLPPADLQGSRKNPFHSEKREGLGASEQVNHNSSIDGSQHARANQSIQKQNSNVASDKNSHRSGRKSTRMQGGNILPAVVQNSSVGQPQSIQAAAVQNSGLNDSQASRPEHRQHRTMEYNQSSQFEEGKPIMKYMEASDSEQKSYPLKYFKGQDLELYYMEKQLKPGVEREIKEGFFEIRKKFGGQVPIEGEEVQVYVSHLCLHNYHPIFCKFNLDVVKTILNFSQIIYLKKGQTLYQQGFNDRYLYVILFGKLKLSNPDNEQTIGQPLNIGWTVGEEILFKSDKKANGGSRLEKCKSLCESCVLGIEKRSLAQIKRTLVEKGQAEEFVKLEVVLRGNYLVKKNWRQ